MCHHAPSLRLSARQASAGGVRCTCCPVTSLMKTGWASPLTSRRQAHSGGADHWLALVLLLYQYACAALSAGMGKTVKRA